MQWYARRTREQGVRLDIYYANYKLEKSDGTLMFEGNARFEEDETGLETFPSHNVTFEAGETYKYTFRTLGDSSWKNMALLLKSGPTG